MAALDRPIVKRRPIYLNLFAIRQPLPAIVSILHRVSGSCCFLIGIPVMLWGVQASLASPDSFLHFTAVDDVAGREARRARHRVGVHPHLLAGLRHLMLDVHVGLDLPSAATLGGDRARAVADPDRHRRGATMVSHI
jgi:succinate dehydrogenase / fumarate reductase cytochrome b subunit